MSELIHSPAWRALVAEQERMRGFHLRRAFADDPGRAARYSTEAAGFYMDWSKHLVDDAVVTRLLDLARQAGIEDWRQRMFGGNPINSTEDRAVLHVALRSGRSHMVDGKDVKPAIDETLERMRRLVDAVHTQRWLGVTGGAIRHIVNIGIGGSDLGPRMVIQALRPHLRHGVELHFVSNVDPCDLHAVLARIDPASTLFVIVSKTFTTQETLANAQAARDWMNKRLGQDCSEQHFVAVSANVPAAQKFGIDARNCLPMWDWVGGRYSLWSAVGLAIALGLGWEGFTDLLAGARQMDEHFVETPLDRNLPVLMGMLGIWYVNFMDARSHAVLPYAQDLHRFPAYLQQLEMESNGKRVDRAGRAVDYATCPVVWGEPGTNGQHAFHQLLHQGPQLIPIDLLVPLRSADPVAMQHETLLANAFAQSAALLRGKTEVEAEQESRDQGMSEQAAKTLASHKVFAGNKPSTTLLFAQLDARTLGALIALYEHKVFVQGMVWNINSFDQWGVELGKTLAKGIEPSLTGTATLAGFDASTETLVARARAARG